MQRYSNVDLKSLPTEELVKLATERLGGVEGVTDLSKHYEGIVVVRIVSCVKHPNADKLNLCKVDDGGTIKDVARDEDGYVQVVCGAPNAREGLLAAWIPPSAIVPASYGEKELFVLEARNLRGQLSNGMLASPAELGLSDDHYGILEIEEDVQPGTPFKDLYDLNDTILEIENKMFTHRPDGFGHLGVAREIAGIQHKAFTSPDWYLEPIRNERLANDDALSMGDEQSTDNGKSPIAHASQFANNTLSIKNEVLELCPRYMAVVLEDIKIAPSPMWLQSYLKRVGVRPINNVVDITNYMMILTAQPLHAFDFDKVAKDGKAEIIVRKPQSGEKMTLLDGKEIEPHEDAVLICNPDGPIALGGVMGGGNSEVDENTTRVVLECATFDMYNIRKTSMIHGIFTDAVTRFTKGQPSTQLPSVIAKAINMFEELVGATQAGDIVDTQQKSKIKNQKSDFIEIDAKFINERLGSKFTDKEIVTLLNNVEIEAHVASGPIEIRPPFWRTDLELKEDIVEEIGRLYGFNQLPMALPQRSIQPVTPDSLRALKSQIRQTLARAGANEVLGYSFVHGNLLKKSGQDIEHAYALRNALSPDLQYYRLSILPSLLDRVHANSKAGYTQFGLFEIGKVHYKNEMDSVEPGVPNEDNHIGFVISYHEKTAPNGSPYFAARRYLAEIAPELADNVVPMADFDMSKDEWGAQLTAPYDPLHAALIVINNQIWGVVGEFKQAVQAAFKLPAYTAGFEVHMDAIKPSDVQYKPLSRYPSTEQDITLKVASELRFEQLQKLLISELAATEYSTMLTPLGIYQKEGENTKNLTFRITLSHHERTLTTNEITKLVESLSWRAHKVLQAEQV